MKPLVLLLLTLTLCAADMKKINEFDSGQMLPQQIFMKRTDNVLVQAIWLPDLFLYTIFRDQKKQDVDMELLNGFDGCSIIMVQVHDVNETKAIPWAKDRVLASVSFDVTINNETHKLLPPKITPPLISAALKSFSDNKSYLGYTPFVVKNATVPKDELILSPVLDGALIISLHGKRFGSMQTMNGEIFEPIEDRNGRRLHPSWKYNPWTGDKLQ